VVLVATAGGGDLGVGSCAVALGVLEGRVRGDFALNPRNPHAPALATRGGARSSGTRVSAREAAR